MEKIRLISIEDFKEMLFCGEAEQVSCRRGGRGGYTKALLQCFKYKNEYYVRLIDCSGDIARVFSNKYSANYYFRVITNGGHYENIKEVA